MVVVEGLRVSWGGSVHDQPAERERERVQMGLRVGCGMGLWITNLQAKEVQMVQMQCGSWGSENGLVACIMVGLVSSLVFSWVNQQTNCLRVTNAIVFAKGHKIRCKG